LPTSNGPQTSSSISNGFSAAKQTYVTHYGVSFKDAFNKKSSLQTDNYGSVKLTGAAPSNARHYIAAHH